MKILIAAGGSGGHIIPALTVAKKLKDLQPALEPIFIGTKRGLENKLVPKSGFALTHLNIGRLNHNVSTFERLTTVFLLPFAFLQAFALILKHRPQFVMGFGGHASGPLLLVASLLKRRTFIWEPNAFPGLANRKLAPFMDECFVVVDEAKKHLNNPSCLKFGIPLREEIAQKFELLPRPETSQRLRIFVFGGSQGSRALNQVVSQLLVENPQLLEKFEFVHQTGALDFEQIKSDYDARSLQIDFRAYIDDMATLYRWADLIICRSGMSTLAELAATGSPAILVPLPSSADDHQKKNALVFVESQAAIMMEQKDFNVESLKSELLRLFSNRAELVEMSKNLEPFFEPNSTQKLAQHLLKYLEPSKKV